MTLGCLWTRRAAEIYHEEGPGRSVCNMGQRGRANAFLPLKGLFSAFAGKWQNLTCREGAARSDFKHLFSRAIFMDINVVPTPPFLKQKRSQVAKGRGDLMNAPFKNAKD